MEYFYLIGLFLFMLISFTYWFYKRYGAQPINVPGPRLFPFIGSFIQFLFNRETFYDWTYGLSQQYDGDIFALSFPFMQPMYFLKKPELVKYVLKDNMINYNRKPMYEIFGDLLGQGLFNNDGNLWKEQRKLASHMFSTKRLNQKAFSSFLTATDKLINIIDRYIDKNEPFDMKDLMFRLTMDSIAEIAFDYDTKCLTTALVPEFTQSMDWCTRYLFYRGNDPFWRLRVLLNIPNEQTYRKKLAILNQTCYKIIQERREKIEEGFEGDDILSQFMKQGNFSDQYLRDIVLTFIIAGRDTTAASLTWLFYELCKAPENNKKIISEIESVGINSDKDEQDVDKYQKLQFIQYSLFETLRLHPPVPMDTKFPENDDILPNGVEVKAGSTIVYSPYIFGRIKQIFGEDVDKFVPERFENNKFTDYEFLAFNAGPRLCLGKFFAILEVKVVMTRLLRRYKFTLVDTQKEFTYSVGITSAMKGPLMLKAERI